MSNIIPFDEPPYRGRSDGEAEQTFDQFLIDEGLQLLAAYRSITDREVRQSVMACVVSISRALPASKP